MRHYDAPISGAIAAVLLSMLLIAPLMRIFAMLIVSVLLIALLSLVGRAWHKDHILIYDAIIIGGAFLTLLYMFSFMAVQDTLLAKATLLIFAIFYIVMAIVLARHEHDGALREHYPNSTTTHESRHALAHKRAQSSVPKRRLFSRIFARADHAHDPAFKRGMEPIPEVKDESEQKHFFRRGVEPLHELHPTHPGVLHPEMEVYGLDGLEQELKAIERKAKKR